MQARLVGGAGGPQPRDAAPAAEPRGRRRVLHLPPPVEERRAEGLRGRVERLEGPAGGLDLPARRGGDGGPAVGPEERAEEHGLRLCDLGALALWGRGVGEGSCALRARASLAGVWDRRIGGEKGVRTEPSDTLYTFVIWLLICGSSDEI